MICPNCEQHSVSLRCKGNRQYCRMCCERLHDRSKPVYGQHTVVDGRPTHGKPGRRGRGRRAGAADVSGDT